MEIHDIELQPAMFRTGTAECTDENHNAMVKG